MRTGLNVHLEANQSLANDQLVINHLKGLVIDGVNKAQSGHVGGAMSSMDFAFILWTEFLSFDPDDPKWLGRDRFVLSAGHESMLMYSLLMANGWLDMNELRAFRQLGSKTPGHPEFGLTPGVECTTGPLGQGAAMSVGMAIAERHFGAVYNDKLFAQRTYAILGDGCMQEDITYGAASLAGHLGLKNLIWYYDKNHKQISGDISRTYSDDVAKLYEAMGWHVICINGHDHSAIRKALTSAQSAAKPVLIIGETTMAKGCATMEGNHDTHGTPLNKNEYQATRAHLGLGEQEEFHWPKEVSAHFQRNFDTKRSAVKSWKESFHQWAERAPERASALEAALSHKIPELPRLNWTDGLATRQSFGKILEAWQGYLPSLMGGSADLEPSNMTEAFAHLVKDFTKENPSGRNLAFGVREFPMSAIANGLALHGGIIPFDATFLTFSDYSRPALRLAAIQELGVIHEFTHDSFYLGEDGPTHQPVEHMQSLRAMPQFHVVRPADSIECEAYFHLALGWNRPSAFCLSRQKLPLLSQVNPEIGDYYERAKRGAWVCLGSGKNADIIFFATGSEVSLAMECASELKKQGLYKDPTVVSVPCWEIFFAQDASYRESVMQLGCNRRVSIEAGATFGWERFVGMNGLMVGLDRFGESAKPGDLAKHFGFYKEAVVERIRKHWA